MFGKGSYFRYALANGMFYFSFGMFISIISVILAGKGASATQISLISSSAAFFSMFMQPFTGFMADRFRSPKKVGMVTLSLAIVAGLLFGYTKSFIFLFLMNGFTQGFMNGTVALSDRLAIASRYPYGSIRVWGSVCFAIAAQLAGFVYDNIGPMMIYYIFVAGIALTIFGFLGMEDIVLHESEHHEKVTTTEVLGALIKNKKFILFTMILFMYQGSFQAQFTYMPLFIQALGGTTTIVGTTLFLSVLSEIPMILFSDRVFSRFSYRSLMIFAIVVTIVRYVWYSTMPSPFMIMVVFFFQGLTMIVMILLSVRIVVEIVDERYVSSAYGISAMLARGLSPLMFMVISGKLLDSFGGLQGFQLMYYLTTGAAIVALGLAFFYKDEKAD